MKYRKKYTSQGANERLVILRMSAQNYFEEIISPRDPLIEALAHKTRDQILEDAEKKIQNILEEMKYVSQFITPSSLEDKQGVS